MNKKNSHTSHIYCVKLPLPPPFLLIVILYCISRQYIPSKGTVVEISSDPPAEKGHARFTTATLERQEFYLPLFINFGSKIQFFFQAYTQSGGKRPFGVSILYIGWDKHYGYQLYQSDPSGNYGGWKVSYLILKL